MSHVLICHTMPGAFPIASFSCECGLRFGLLAKKDISDPCNERLAGLIHCHRQHAKIQSLLILEGAGEIDVCSVPKLLEAQPLRSTEL